MSHHNGLGIEAYRVRGLVGVDLPVRLRVTRDGELIVPADVEAAYLQIFDASGAAVENSELTVADTFFADLQTSDEWTADSEGYNMEFTLPGDALSDATHKYPAVVWCVPSGDGSDFPVRLVVDLTPVQKASYPA